MASINKHTIIGKLGRDVEVKSSQNGNAYAFFSVATDDYIGKGADGKAQTETTWHNVKVFGKQAEIVGQYGKKGMSVYVEGRVQHSTDKDNDKVVYHNIIADKVLVFGSNGNGNGNGNSAQAQTQAQSSAQADRGAARAAAAQEPVAVAAGSDGSDDDLPF